MESLCYTTPRCKVLKTKVLWGFPPIPGVTQIPAVSGPRDIRQMDMQAYPPGSLFRGNDRVFETFHT